MPTIQDKGISRKSITLSAWIDSLKEMRIHLTKETIAKAS